MNSISKRLRASVNFDAHNGNSVERSICAKQMLEAANVIDDMTQLLKHVASLDDGDAPYWWTDDHSKLMTLINRAVNN